MIATAVTSASDKRLLALAHVLGSPVVLISLDGVIVYPNPAFCILYGYAAEELVGQPFTMLSAEPEGSRKAFADRRNTVLLRIHRHKTGALLKLELNLDYPVEAEDTLVLMAVRCFDRHSTDDEDLRWRQSVEFSGDGVWDWNLKTGQCFFSENWCRMLGYDTPQQTSDRNFWLAQMHPEDRQQVDAAMEDCLSGRQELYSAEYRLRCQDGAWKWISARGRIVEREHGHPVRILGTHRDIDALKKSLSDWQGARQLFSELLEQTPDAVAITRCDADCAYLEVNAAYCDLVGYTRKELMEAEANDFSFWNNALQANAARELLTNGIAINDLRCTFKSRDGHEVNTSLSARKILVEGEPRFLVVRRDISERILAEMRLRESEARWRFAIEGHGDALWDWNITDKSVYRSLRWLEILRLPLDAINVSEAVHGQVFDTEDLPVVSIGLRDLISGKIDELSQICRLRCGDGEQIWVSYRCRVIDRLENGRAARVVGTMRDISVQRQRQKDMDAKLERLSHSGRLLMLGEMVSTIAHEINQPLAVISSYAGVLVRKAAEQPELRVFAERVEEQSLRAGNIVWRMLQFARQNDLVIEQVNVRKLVEESLEWMRMDSNTMGITFSTDVPVGLAPVFADKVQIQQVLMNLLRNAVHSMAGMKDAETERRISLRVRQDSRRHEAIFEVADRGSGLPSQVAFDVFKPFFTTKEDGLGLGLSICKSIITRHGGNLWSSARTKGGTVFSFSIPQPKDGEQRPPEFVEEIGEVMRRGELP